MATILTAGEMADITDDEKKALGIEVDAQIIHYCLLDHEPTKTEPIIIGFHVLRGRFPLKSREFKKLVALFKRKGWLIEAVDIYGNEGPEQGYRLSITKTKAAAARSKTRVMSKSELTRRRMHLNSWERELFDQLLIAARKAQYETIYDEPDAPVDVPLDLPEDVLKNLARSKLIRVFRAFLKSKGWTNTALEQKNGVWYLHLR